MQNISLEQRNYSRKWIISTGLGAVTWLVYAAWQRPLPTDTGWAVALLLLGPLVIVPLGLRLVLSQESPSFLGRLLQWIQYPAALILVLSFLIAHGALAGALTIPWFLTTGLIALLGLLQIAKGRFRSPPQLCASMGLVFLVVGGGWTLMSRFGMRPMGFENIIVLLTGIHFHYAGFALPIIAGAIAMQRSGLTATMACFTVMAGVPAVAVGITASQMGYSAVVECGAAWLMSLSGLLVAVLHFRHALQKTETQIMRGLWLVVSVSLFFGMGLSALYGTRAFVDVTWLDIPVMRALHGTANALGFCLLGLIAWNLRGSE